MAENAERKQRRGRGRPFEPGQSGNPAGKPRGSRHATTMLAEKLMSDDVEGVVKAVVEAAKGGDMTAARIVMDRIAPARKGAPAPIDLPAITTAVDVEAALVAVTNAMAAGDLSPDEAATVAGVIELRRKAIETSEFDRRLRAVEEQQEKRKP